MAKEKLDDNLVFQQCPWLEAIRRDNCSDTLGQVLDYPYLEQHFAQSRTRLTRLSISKFCPSYISLVKTTPLVLPFADFPHTRSVLPNTHQFTLLQLFLYSAFLLSGFDTDFLQTAILCSHRYQTMNRGSLTFFCSSFYKEYIVDIQEAWVVRLIHTQPINLGEMI